MSNPTEPKDHPHNEELRAQMLEFITARGITRVKLAHDLGFHFTQISKWLGGKPDWNCTALEQAAADYLKHAGRRSAAQADLFDTNVTDSLAATFDRIRRTHDVGLIHGAAGIGKTSGIILYEGANPTTIVITLSEWACDSGGMTSALFGAVDSKSYDHRTPRAEWLANRMKGSDRLLVIDNAHRLRRRGLQFLFDFHDLTGLPIALVGNPEILHAISANDQQFSRIGICKALKLADPGKVAGRLVQQVTPDAGDELDALAEQVCAERGGARALKKQLRLAARIKEDSTKPITLETAFRAAHTQLVRGYQLAK